MVLDLTEVHLPGQAKGLQDLFIDLGHRLGAHGLELPKIALGPLDNLPDEGVAVSTENALRTHREVKLAEPLREYRDQVGLRRPGPEDKRTQNSRNFEAVGNLDGDDGAHERCLAHERLHSDIFIRTVVDDYLAVSKTDYEFDVLHGHSSCNRGGGCLFPWK